MRKVVVNTTPLIALSHVGRLDILKDLYGEIIIPEAVYKELSAKSESVCKETCKVFGIACYISQNLIELCLKQVGEG